MFGCGRGQLRTWTPGRENEQEIVCVDDAVGVDIGVSVLGVPGCDHFEDLIDTNLSIAIDVWTVRALFTNDVATMVDPHAVDLLGGVIADDGVLDSYQAFIAEDGTTLDFADVAFDHSVDDSK